MKQELDELKVGKFYSYKDESEDPWKRNDVNSYKILDIKRGYVRYRCCGFCLSGWKSSEKVEYFLERHVKIENTNTFKEFFYTFKIYPGLTMLYLFDIFLILYVAMRLI